MTEIDSAAFEAGVAPCNFTAGRIDSADESDAAHFSAALGRIYITAQALLLSARPQAGHTQPALTLVVEDSADGSSWATVATFPFTASDQPPGQAVDSPRAYLRASWTDVVGTWAVDVAVKSIATPASGGGSLPPQWSVDGDGNLDITPDGDGAALALQVKSPLSLDDGGVIFEIDADTGASTVFYVAGDGAYVCDDDGNPYVGFRPDGSIALGPTLDNAGLNLTISGARIDLPSGGTLKVYSSDGHELLNVEDGGFLSFKNTSGQYVFQVRNDGSIHIPSGTTIQADL